MDSTNNNNITGRPRGSGHGGPSTEKTAPKKPGRRRVDATLGGSCSSSSDRHQAEAASGIVNNDVNNESVNNINNRIVDNNIIDNNVSAVQNADLGTSNVRTGNSLRICYGCDRLLKIETLDHLLWFRSKHGHLLWFRSESQP